MNTNYLPKIELEYSIKFNGEPMHLDEEQWAHLGELLTEGDEIKVIAVHGGMVAE